MQTIIRKIRAAVRCGERLYPGLGEDQRCRRLACHLGAHRDPHGDVWSGRRR